jgi:hypothetical protein
MGKMSKPLALLDPFGAGDFDLQSGLAVVVSDNHPAMIFHAELFIERAQIFVADKINHIEVFQLLQKPPDQFAANTLFAVFGEDFKKRDIGGEDAIGDCINETDDTICAVVNRQYDVRGGLQNRKVSFGCWRFRPADEETGQVKRVDARD